VGVVMAREWVGVGWVWGWAGEVGREWEVLGWAGLGAQGGWEALGGWGGLGCQRHLQQQQQQQQQHGKSCHVGMCDSAA
jgi:hypothetical protein